MADNLIFPIGFDLKPAVDNAIVEWNGKYASKLEAQIQKRALNVRLGFNTRDLDNLDDVKRRLAELKIEPLTPENKAAIKDLVRELKELARIMEKIQKFKGVELPELQMAKAAKLRKEVEQANEKLRLSQERVRQAEERLILAQKRAEQQAYKTGKAFQSQEGYVSRLLKRLAVYASFQMVGNFLTNVREVTAQFELQRISLGAIIQDQQKANQIFAEIKAFALTSPLKILDLTKYAKQMAAYGFEANRVFDVTKRLADISVGLGVDMGRLSLAVSQIRAATVLKSSELRQLTETGLPMLDLLSKKLTETQGKLVSAADVMDLISKRAISYEMVEEILYDLTDAGGMFYNMQVKQSQTLFGMWSKLGDAAALMYDQIGNTSSINVGMKMTIGALESLMRNWKTTARVLDAVGVALGVYVVGLKSAEIASKATTTAEAARLAVTNRHIIATPKLVASIIGQNAATKLSTVLTKAHTVAMLNQSTATNVLTKGFWKLTAAMLANPWVAAAAAIGAVAAALFHFIGNTETAAERTENLNNAVASLKNLGDTITPLVDSYNELINKTERTAEEEKKLSEVTHELAQRYPGAITAIGNFGNEVELATDKLNKLYQAEKGARMENTRYELSETEKKIKEVEAEIAKYQKQIERGTKVVYKRLGDSGLRTKKIVPLTDEDKGRILKQIDELRYGEDGQSGLFGLQQSAEEARRALSGITPDEAAIEKFGAWKKAFTTFRKEVGGIRISLFEDSTINQFGSLEEALEKTAKKYKDNIALVKTYDEVLKSTLLNAEERAKIESERAEADTMAKLAKEALDYYNTLYTAFDKNKGGRAKSDPRLGILQEMVSTLKQVNKEYDDLAKKEGATRALTDTQRVYADTFKNMRDLAKKYRFDLPDFGVPTDAASLGKYLDSIREAMKKLPKSDKAVLALQVDIEKSDIDNTQKQVEARLKSLSVRISRSKTAREFYDKVLGTTGDSRLASRVAESIFGQNGENLQRALADQVRGMTNGIELPEGIISADNIIDYKALRSFADANKKELGGMYDELVKISEQGQKDLAKTFEGYLKDLEKAKTYSDKRIELARYTANQIAEIEASGLPEQEKGRLRQGYREREEREAVKLDYEAFKEMPMYVQMFDDLDNASTAMLTNMRDKLMGMREAWSNLDPTQLKELQSRLWEVDEQLAQRNPFKTLGDAVKEYRRLSKEGSKGDAEAKLVAATKEQAKAKVALSDALERETKAQAEYNEAVREYGKDSAEAKDAKVRLDFATSTVGRAKELVVVTKRDAEAAENLVNNWKKVEDSIGMSLNEVFQIVNSLGDLASGIGKLTETFGGSEEDVQYWNDLASGIGEVTSGLESMVKSALSLNVAGIVSGAVTAIPSMISGFANIFSAGKVRKANKEIKRQQELLDQLEYAYSRLEKAMDKAFGGDYITNVKRQKSVLEAQARAYQAQYSAEWGKGKKADEEKLKGYEDAYRDTIDAIADLEGQVAAQMLGSDLTSAARDFAKAWLDAYKEFGNTADAMSGKFKEMIENMVVEGALGRVMERALEPMFKMIDDMGEQDFYSQDFWRRVVAEAEKGADAANAGATTMMKYLENAGISMRDLGTDLTGISRDIASASEESINGLAAGINTQNYYIAQQLTEVRAIRAFLESGGMAGGGASGYADLVTLQNTAMGHLQSINQHTAETVVECRRIAERCTAMASDIHKVVVPRGTKGAHGIQVYM